MLSGSFVISLAIAIAINYSPVSGFTVARNILDLTPDQEAGESKLSKVRYDLKTLNNNNGTINNHKTTENSESTVIAINDSNNYKQNYSYDNEIQTVVNEIADTTTIISTETDSYSFTNYTLSEIQTTTTEPTYQYPSTLTSVETLFTNIPEIYNMKEYSTATGVPDDQDNMTDLTSTANPDLNNTSNDVTSNDADKSENNTNYFINTIQNTEPESEYTTAVLLTTIANSESTTETDPRDQKADQATIKEESTIAKTDGSPSTPTAKVSTETATGDLKIDLLPTLPPWKKYTTIYRKYTSTRDITTTEKEMVQAETAQTRITLQVMTTTNAPGTDAKEIHATDNKTSEFTTKMNTETKTETTKLEIASRRAGFIDNRHTTTPKPEEVVRGESQPTVSTKNIETYSTEYEIEADAEMTNNKNISLYDSPTQLADDAIKEELLKEKTLSDNEKNAMYKHMKQENLIYDLGTVSDVALSVKPIGLEKKKNSILYSVSPNYKPLKKIDVQPPKQFVRDPDDNSWRNESISSLGIVFKPKNASKSFTQVLKNKTETELGNITDKDSKSDLPDLRVRLEKIAEVRKSKKKINKFGDTVYSDYEESGENADPFRSDTTTPMSSSVESTTTITTPPPSQSSTTKFDLTVNAISKEPFDMFKNEKASPITTNKPNKFYKLAEYYDTSDEYDADYENKHKIDIKKFTKPITIKEGIATQSPGLLRTQPMREYQPLRVATLQYFPPTQKIVQKVNMNAYDTDFNRKVNLYNFDKVSPKNVISTSFGTVSPIPTENNEKLNRVTIKPPYTSMYQTDNFDKNLYLTNQQRVSELPRGGLVANDADFNRASYVIKHYRDFIDEAAKGDDDRSDFSFTESPVQGVTVNELTKMTPQENNQGEDDYEYETKFRKDIMNRFVDNFNQNSERFKVTFPILYNTSVVHRQTPSTLEHGRVASSSAFIKRLYEVGNPKSVHFLRKTCDPHCEKTVELSPAYELHYYVPDEEEKEEIQTRPMIGPYRYRL